MRQVSLWALDKHKSMTASRPEVMNDDHNSISTWGNEFLESSVAYISSLVRLGCIRPGPTGKPSSKAENSCVKLYVSSMDL